MENCIVGVPAKIHFCSNTDITLSAINSIIDSLRADGINNIVILTCKTESGSILCPYLKNGAYLHGNEFVLFTTCRRFKGLEADAVVLVDVEQNTFIGNAGQNVLLFYVGTSRARLRLDIVTQMNDDECIEVLRSLGKTDKIKRPMRELARSLNALHVVDT